MLYFKFGGPERALEQFLQRGNHPNPLAGDFGLYTQADVEAFIADELPRFAVVLLSER